VNHVLSPISQPTLDVTPIWMPCHWKEVRKLQNSSNQYSLIILHKILICIQLHFLSGCLRLTLVSHTRLQFYEIQIVVVLERHVDFLSGHTF